MPCYDNLDLEWSSILLEVAANVYHIFESTSITLIDPITLTVEEKINVSLKRDGGMSNFDVQGTLSLQILNQEDGLIQVQVLFFLPASLAIYFS